jgi:LysR family transcriptional activator of nhaA
MLLPTRNTSLRRALDAWFDEADVRPRVVAEFEDSALLKVFGQAGAGVFVVPEVLAAEVRRHYRVERVGPVTTVRETVYAITADRKIKHPAAAALVAEIARSPVKAPPRSHPGRKERRR